MYLISTYSDASICQGFLSYLSRYSCSQEVTGPNLWKDVGLERCEWHVPTVEGRVSEVDCRWKKNGNLMQQKETRDENGADSWSNNVIEKSNMCSKNFNNMCLHFCLCVCVHHAFFNRANRQIPIWVARTNLMTRKTRKATAFLVGVFLATQKGQKERLFIWLVVSTLKNMLVKLGSSSPSFGVKTNIYLSCHHLVMFTISF